MTRQTRFSVYWYQHTDPVNRSRHRMVLVGASLVLALAVMAVFSASAGAMLLAIPLLGWVATPRKLLLGPRYLLCGQTIVYFGNVKRITLSPTHGKLRLECTNGSAFILERKRFPSPVRTIERFSRSRSTRFDRLSAKIIARVRAASTNAVLITA